MLLISLTKDSSAECKEDEGLTLFKLNSIYHVESSDEGNLKEELETILNLLSHSSFPPGQYLPLHYIKKQLSVEENSVFVETLIEAGGLDSIIQYCLNPILKTMDSIITALFILNHCIFDVEMLEKSQVESLSSLLSHLLQKYSGDKEAPQEEESKDKRHQILKTVMKIIQRCYYNEDFAVDFFYLFLNVENSTISLMKTQDDLQLKKDYIDLLTKIFGTYNTASKISPHLCDSIVNAFASDFHAELSPLWFRLLAMLIKVPLFSKAFMKFGGLRTVLATLKIPHIEDVFVPGVKIVRVLSKEGRIPAIDLKTSNRNKLIEILSALCYESKPIDVLDLKKTKLTRHHIKTEPSNARAAEENSKQATSGILQKMQQERKTEEQLPIPKASSNQVPKKDTKPRKMKLAEPPQVPVVQEEIEIVKSIPLTSLEATVFHSKWNHLLASLDRKSDDCRPIMAELEKLIIQNSISQTDCESLCLSLKPFFKERDPGILIALCSITFHLICQEDLHESLFYNGTIKEVVLILEGYNLTVIEQALVVLDRYCISEKNISLLCEFGILNSLLIIVDSYMESIRVKAKTILEKVLQMGNEVIVEKLNILYEQNPWSSVSSLWTQTWQINRKIVN